MLWLSHSRSDDSSTTSKSSINSHDIDGFPYYDSQLGGRAQKTQIPVAMPAAAILRFGMP
jgi:hypothetical protein